MPEQPSRLSTATRPLVFLSVLIGLLLTGLVGCSGGSNVYSRDVSDLAERSMPAVRRALAHPDSLRLLSIVEQESRLRFELKRSYQRMHEAWSSSFRFASARPDPARPLTYATLWSKELSLASLEPEESFSSLPKDKARALIDQMTNNYEKTLQIDVYWFSGPDGRPITGPSATVRLRDGEGNSYRPTREENGPLREAFILGTSSVLYRRNIFYFRRQLNERDIL